MNIEWPCGPTYWTMGRTLCVSIPFTWNLPEVRRIVRVGSLVHDNFLVGGPAVEMMPGYFDGIPGVTVGHEYPGVLQRVNPQATRSTTGCVRKCEFCAIGTGRIESGGMKRLDDWPDLPVYCDNNILSAGRAHFDRVMDRLEKHGWGDFNQGIDARLLIEYHAERFMRVKGLTIRLALDSESDTKRWEKAFDILRAAGIALSRIRSYVLIGFNSGSSSAWRMCRWIETFGVKPLPMWFHRLDAMEPNVVTCDQEKEGWTDFERRRIMQWFYQHKEAVA